MSEGGLYRSGEHGGHGGNGKYVGCDAGMVQPTSDDPSVAYNPVPEHDAGG